MRESAWMQWKCVNLLYVHKALCLHLSADRVTSSWSDQALSLSYPEQIKFSRAMMPTVLTHRRFLDNCLIATRLFVLLICCLFLLHEWMLCFSISRIQTEMEYCDEMYQPSLSFSPHLIRALSAASLWYMCSTNSIQWDAVRFEWASSVALNKWQCVLYEAYSLVLDLLWYLWPYLHSSWYICTFYTLSLFTSLSALFFGLSVLQSSASRSSCTSAGRIGTLGVICLPSGLCAKYCPPFIVQSGVHTVAQCYWWQHRRLLICLCETIHYQP